MCDTSTLVLVIQTEQYHADIRIPSNRPDFSGIKCLANCSIDQLRWLATQQGFTGNYANEWQYLTMATRSRLSAI